MNSKIVKNIFIFFGSIFLILSFIFLIVFIKLNLGINLSFHQDNININKLYLKYDKKLILKVNKIKILPSDTPSKFDFSVGFIDIGYNILQLFDIIEIKELDSNNMKIYLKYHKNKLVVKSKDFNIYIDILKKNNKYSFFIQDSNYKNINFHSKIDLDMNSLKLNSYGKIKLKDIKLDFDISYLNNILKTKLKTNKITSLKPILKYYKFNLPFKAKSYFIKNLEFKINLDNQKIFYNDLKADIVIQKIRYKDMISDILISINNNYLILNSNILDISTSFKVGNKYSLDNLYLEYKKDKIYIQNGKIDIDKDFTNGKINFKISYKDFFATIIADIKNRIAKIKINNKQPFSSLKIINDFTKLNKSLQEWIIDRTKGDSFFIKDAYLVFDIKNRKIVFDKLKVDLIVKNLVLNFKDSIYPLKSKKTLVKIANNRVDFLLTNPTYNNISLKGSSAYIKNVFVNGVLDIKLKINHIIDKNILGAIKAYGVELPAKQIDGESFIFTDIIVPFDDRKTKVYAKVNSKNSNFLIFDNQVYFKKLNLEYKDNKVVIKDSIIKRFIEKNKYILKFNSNINLSTLQLILNAKLLSKGIDIDILNRTDLSFKTTAGELKINKLNFKEYSIKDKIPYFGSFYNEIFFFLPKQSIYFYKDKINSIKIYNLEKLLKKLNIDLKFNINTKIVTRDFKDFNIDLNLNNLDYPIFYRNKQLSSFNFNIKGDVNNLVIKDRKKLVYIRKKKDKYKIILNNIDIKIPKSDNKEKTNNKDDVLEKKLNLPFISLEYNNFNIFFNNQKFKFDKLKLFTNKDNITLKLFFFTSGILVKKEGKNIFFYSFNLKDKFLNKLIGKEIFENGKIKLILKGDINNIKGSLILKDTKIKNIGIINSVVAFINSSPAVINPLLALPTFVTLVGEGFNLKGYKIKQGFVNFNYDRKKELLVLDEFQTKGVFADFYGKGIINLKENKVKLVINIVFMKEYSFILGHIPVVGYILLGKDKKIRLSIEVYGDLDNPKVKTHMIKETFGGIFNIAKRIITLPLKVFETEDDKNKE